MKNKEIKENVTDEIPLATIVINEYKEMNKQLNDTNERLRKSNKTMAIIALILLVFSIVETTYIILYWDSLHPYAGAIREDCDE